MWDIWAWRRITLPVAVRWKRFCVPLWVRILGIVGGAPGGRAGGCRGGLCGGGRALRPSGLLLAQRAQDHDHVASLDERVALDGGDLLELVGHAVEQATSVFLVHHLATAEHDRQLDLVPLLEEVAHVA